MIAFIPKNIPSWTEARLVHVFNASLDAARLSRALIYVGSSRMAKAENSILRSFPGAIRCLTTFGAQLHGLFVVTLENSKSNLFHATLRTAQTPHTSFTKHAPMFAFSTARRRAASLSTSPTAGDDTSMTSSSALDRSEVVFSSASSSSSACEGFVSRALTGLFGRQLRADRYATRASFHFPARKWSLPSCFLSFAISRWFYMASG